MDDGSQYSVFDVSIVIVCMKDIKNIVVCIDSIVKCTSCKYEILVTAYLLGELQIEELKIKYPHIVIIRSENTRGFSENNNLALKHVRGKYTLILNDDTIMEMAAIDELIRTLDANSEYAVATPIILNGDGTIQSIGHRSFSMLKFFFPRIRNYSVNINDKSIDNVEVVYGCCFLIRTAIFSDMGFFDERFFFGPEDVALCMKMRDHGHKICVNKNIKITHYHYSRTTIVRSAVTPATYKGTVILISDRSRLLAIIYVVAMFFKSFLRFFTTFLMKNAMHRRIIRTQSINMMRASISCDTPKDIFIRFSRELGI